MIINYTPYQTRIRECFAAAYRFLDEHKQARTSDDWTRIVKDTEPYKEPLEIDLIAACLAELEREYRESKQTTAHAPAY